MVIRNPLIFDAAISANWAMDEAALQAVIEIASREHQITPEALEAYRAQELDRAERATVRDGVAILNVDGPLFKRANLMTMFCGATSYDVLRRDLQTALDNASVRAILLNVNSPGGEAAGVSELAQAIFEARGQKPIVAYAGDQAASAAYWIASAADKIVVGQTAALGSIGVRAALTDTSARDQARGIKTVEFVSSQSPFKKVDLNTKQGRDRIQARVDAMAAVFVETVANYRGASVAHVLEAFGKGDVLIGKAAIDAGMADDFGTFESVLASLARGESPIISGSNPAVSGQSNEGITMENETGDTAAETKPEVTTTTSTNPGAAAAPAVVATNDGLSLVAAERKRVTDIMALTLPGYEGDAAKAIETGSSAHEFSAMIIAAEKAKRTERAAAVKTDTEANAEVSPSTGKERATGDDAAVSAILGAFKLATGIN
ncbi:S49 family peptidase [Rhodopseudomonas palustris]|uniref:S49 family peptidase n=1 Tax=Rhodopseudomonas palustris TaxID=1076 RepID=UPI00069A216D|nr:S49 family peptidase [Rhodopseudomonas palustris]